MEGGGGKKDGRQKSSNSALSPLPCPSPAWDTAAPTGLPWTRAAKVVALEVADSPAVVLDIPLLFETGGEKFVDIVVVVDAPTDIQEERVLSRPNMTKEKLEKIIAEQIPNDIKKEKADFVVDTSVSIEDAKLQVINILKKIKN